MANEKISIKGTSNGLIITLGAGAWPGLLEELDARLGEKASFFKGGRVALRVGPRQMNPAQLTELGHTLDKHQVTLWAVESESPDTLEAAAALGLEVETSDKPAATAVAGGLPPPVGDSIVIQRTLRSGQVVEHSGHVVVIGDVNPGAEIRAGGSVVVWGRLRGAVRAGLGEQGEEAVVCALYLAPTQLRIGSYLALSPVEENAQDVVPEMAFVQDFQIVAEPWRNY